MAGLDAAAGGAVPGEALVHQAIGEVRPSDQHMGLGGLGLLKPSVEHRPGHGQEAQKRHVRQASGEAGGFVQRGVGQALVDGEVCAAVIMEAANVD